MCKFASTEKPFKFKLKNIALAQVSFPNDSPFHFFFFFSTVTDLFLEVYVLNKDHN